MTEDGSSYHPLAAEQTYPLQELLGFEITRWADGYARVEQPLHQALNNRYGIPHGGVYAVLMDVAAGFCGCWCPVQKRRRTAMTLSLNISYIGQPVGKRLIAEGRKSGGGRKTYFASITLTDDAGTLVATAQAVLRYRGNGGDLQGDPVESAN